MFRTMKLKNNYLKGKQKQEPIKRLSESRLKQLFITSQRKDYLETF